jgi:hypothetical protein
LTSRAAVTTPERFQQGLLWNEWVEQIDRNQEKFRENYESTIVNAEGLFGRSLSSQN